MEAALIGVADIHAWALANGLQSFEFIDLRGIVLLRGSDLGGGF
jgi:hypothetical protein